MAAVPRCTSPRIEIHKAKRSLALYCGEALKVRLKVALGGEPEGAKLRQGDHKTPVGEYRVVTRNRRSRFHLFLGLSYPNIADAKRALGERRISRSHYQRVVLAITQGRRPPWNTAMGGAIGIHGVGKRWGFLGSIHRASDWTDGCIAVTNDEIEKIWGMAPMGTRVSILK